MAVEYKFKPYTPQNLKIANPQSSLSQQEKTLKSLQSQRENLDARLRAEGIDPDTLGGEFDNRNLFEKALNLTPDQNFLFDFFEIIDRPVQAIKQAALAGQDGENLLKGFWEGLSGQEEVSGADFVKEFTGGYEPQTGLGKFLLNVGTDIVLDPLTYIPPGWFLKGFKKIGGIGSAARTTEVIEQAIKSVAQKAADDFVSSTMKAAEAIVADTGSNINNIDDALRQVIKTRSTGNVRDIYFFDQEFKNIDDIVDFVKGGGREVEFIKPKKGVPSVLQKRVQMMQDLMDGKLELTGAAKSEADYYRKIYKEIEKLDPNIKVILNKASDRFDDVAIFYKTKINGKTALVKVDAIEVKSMLKKGAKKSKAAFFSNIGLKVSPEGKLIFGEGTTLTPRMQQIMMDTFSKVKVGNRTLNEFLIEAAKRTSKKGLDDFYKLTDDEGRKLLRQMFEDISKESGIGFTFIDTGNGTGKLIDVAENLDQFEETFSIVYNQGQMRFNTGFNVRADADFLGIPDQTKNLLKRFQQRPGGTQQVTEIWTLARRAREGEFGEIARKLATTLKNIEMSLKINFNLTAGLSPEARDLIRKAYGENLFELERRSAKLAQLKADLIKIDPKAGEILAEIIESGARLTPDGRIVKIKRRMGTSDFLDYILVRTQDKAEILLPKFPDQAAKKSFLQKLNKMWRDYSSSGDDLFEVVEKGAGTALKFDAGPEDIKEFIKWFNEQQTAAAQGFRRNIPEYMEFGEKALSKQTKKFLLENTAKIDEYRGLSDEILQELVDVAGFDNLPRELAGQIGYMRHAMSMEAYKALQRQMPGVASIFARPGTNVLKQRRFLGSVDEINAGMREFMGLEVDLFDPNAFNAMEDLIKVAHRKLDQARVLDIILTQKGINAEDLLRVVPNTQDFAKTLTPYDKMFKNFKEEFGALYKNLSPQAQARMDEFFKAAGYADDSAIVMNKSAYNILKGAEKAYLDIPPLIKMYDKFLNFWKGTTLVSPGFHLRNLFGNMFNSYAAGMDIASQGKYLTTAVTELDEFQKIGKKLAQGGKLTDSEKKLFDLVRGYFEGGVSQTHRGIRDLEQLKAGVDEKTLSKIKSGYNNILKFNFNVAEKMDDVQRYALYRWALDTTGDVKKATNKVAEALFDYSHLTPFEKEYMKRIFPFYTFMKNNFIFQAKSIFANPKAYARTGRAYNYAIEDLAGYSPEDLPDYATENMWLPIPMTVNKNDKKAIAFLKANLPLSDFTELVENPFKKGVISITAPVKLLIEFGAGRDLFTGAPLSQFPGQTNAMEAGTGVLSGLRDRRGNLTITQSPLFQKILNDIGLRTPINVASAGVDLVDTLTGYQGGSEGLGDFMARAGLVGVQEVQNLELTALYQDLENLRELKKYYEQETGNQLPVLPRG